MTARHAWREAWRATRQELRPRWVHRCFPASWAAEYAARRLGRPAPALGPVPHRVAVALSVAAAKRRSGEIEAARMFTGFARRANADRLTPSPAIGA